MCTNIIHLQAFGINACINHTCTQRYEVSLSDICFSSSSFVLYPLFKSKFRHLLFFSFSKIDICLKSNRRRKGASQKGRFNRLRAFSEDVLSSRKDAEIQLRLRERANLKEILDLKRSLKHDSVLPVRLRFELKSKSNYGCNLAS